MHPFCNNARSFVKRFHDEGIHDYDAECGAGWNGLEKRINVVVNSINNAAAGKYFREYHVLTRSDLTLLENNIKYVRDIKTVIQTHEENAKKRLRSHFSKAGKLLSVHSYTKLFDENIIGKLKKVEGRTLVIEASLAEKLEKSRNIPHVSTK